jgi:hypothetical protein
LPNVDFRFRPKAKKCRLKMWDSVSDCVITTGRVENIGQKHRFLRLKTGHGRVELANKQKTEIESTRRTESRSGMFRYPELLMRG